MEKRMCASCPRIFILIGPETHWLQPMIHPVVSVNAARQVPHAEQKKWRKFLPSTTNSTPRTTLLSNPPLQPHQSHLCDRKTRRNPPSPAPEHPPKHNKFYSP